MAVFTEVSFEEASQLTRAMQLGELLNLQGCAGGIENTNYFVSTQRDGVEHHYVLTLFERLRFEQLPFYLHLMKHLAMRGIPVPDPQTAPASALPYMHPGSALLLKVRDKPAALVNRLQGASELQPGQAHCAAVGATLARMHLAGADFERTQPNLRGLAWWNETVPVVLPFLNPEQGRLIGSELAYQNHVASTALYRALPRGPIHADLFRDNVMFRQEPSQAAGEPPELTGFFDFYFAGNDSWLYDVAVCLNDWCVDLPTGGHDAQRCEALLQAYQAVRAFSAAERALLPAMLRAAALRFWISRLWDLHLPRDAAVLKPHDPTHFERVLRARVESPVTLAA